MEKVEEQSGPGLYFWLGAIVSLVLLLCGVIMTSVDYRYIATVGFVLIVFAIAILFVSMVICVCNVLNESYQNPAMQASKDVEDVLIFRGSKSRPSKKMFKYDTLVIKGGETWHT